jgi:hypothetical protein
MLWIEDLVDLRRSGLGDEGTNPVTFSKANNGAQNLPTDLSRVKSSIRQERKFVKPSQDAAECKYYSF